MALPLPLSWAGRACCLVAMALRRLSELCESTGRGVRQEERASDEELQVCSSGECGIGRLRQCTSPLGGPPLPCGDLALDDRLKLCKSIRCLLYRTQTPDATPLCLQLRARGRPDPLRLSTPSRASRDASVRLRKVDGRGGARGRDAVATAGGAAARRLLGALLRILASVAALDYSCNQRSAIGLGSRVGEGRTGVERDRTRDAVQVEEESAGVAQGLALDVTSPKRSVLHDSPSDAT